MLLVKHIHLCYARQIFTVSIDFSIKSKTTFMGKEIDAIAYIPWISLK